MVACKAGLAATAAIIGAFCAGPAAFAVEAALKGTPR